MRCAPGGTSSWPGSTHDARGRERTIAVNLDHLGIVVAVEPREPPGYVDRGIVIARAAGMNLR